MPCTRKRRELNPIHLVVNKICLKQKQIFLHYAFVLNIIQRQLK